MSMPRFTVQRRFPANLRIKVNVSDSPIVLGSARTINLRADSKHSYVVVDGRDPKESGIADDTGHRGQHDSEDGCLARISAGRAGPYGSPMVMPEAAPIQPEDA